MIRRASECWPKILLDEYRRLAAIPEPFVAIEMLEMPNFQCRFLVDTMLRKLFPSGSDICGSVASVAWLKEGPKIVNVTPAQYQVLSNIDVRLELKDFSMPYPTMLVNLPEGLKHRYVIIHRYAADILILLTISHDHQDDVSTIIRQWPGRFVEESLDRYDVDLKNIAETSCQSLRVACNMMLAMSNYGCYSEYLFPKEVEQEKKFIAKGDRPGREGRTASDRLKEQPLLVCLDQHVRLCKHEKEDREESTPTGREVRTHFRRGHWCMQPYGPGNALRKPVLRPPVIVRADLLTVPASEITTTYQ